MVLIPGCALQHRATVGDCGEPKLASAGDQEPFQVRRVDLGKRVPLAHRRRVARHGEAQEPRLVPDLDRLNKWTRRELAAPHRPDALTVDFRPDRVRQPGADFSA